MGFDGQIAFENFLFIAFISTNGHFMICKKSRDLIWGNYCNSLETSKLQNLTNWLIPKLDTKSSLQLPEGQPGETELT